MRSPHRLFRPEFFPPPFYRGCGRYGTMSYLSLILLLFNHPVTGFSRFGALFVLASPVMFFVKSLNYDPTPQAPGPSTQADFKIWILAGTSVGIALSIAVFSWRDPLLWFAQPTHSFFPLWTLPPFSYASLSRFGFLTHPTFPLRDTVLAYFFRSALTAAYLDFFPAAFLVR